MAMLAIVVPVVPRWGDRMPTLQLKAAGDGHVASSIKLQGGRTDQIEFGLLEQWMAGFEPCVMSVLTFQWSVAKCMLAGAY